MLTPGKLKVYERSSATLNWNYNLSMGLATVVLQFNEEGIVLITADGQAGLVNSKFRQRFKVYSTKQSVSLVISKVSTTDDKSNGEFICELTDVSPAKWRRAIQVQVIGKLKKVLLTFRDSQHE